MNRARIGAFCVLAGVGAAFGEAGCATLAGLDDDYQPAPVCDPVRPTAAPGVKNVGGDVEFVVAFRKVDLDEDDEAPRIGYDIDGKCSCTIDGQSCAPPSWAEAKDEVCDDPRGLDNATGIALARISDLANGGVTSILINEGSALGQWSVLVRVKGYSGTPDDDQVEVSVYETPGRAAMPPAWDGTDVWPVSNTSVAPGSMNVDAPIRVDPAAYVRGGVLVARIEEFPLLFVAPTVRMPINIVAATLTAKIEPAAGGGYRLNEGTISAKWPIPAVFQALSGLRFGATAEDKLCRTDVIYLQVRGLFCSEIDILLDPEAMGAEGGAPQCNAMSFGMGFEAEPIVLGAVTDPAPPPSTMCEAGLDPIDDECR